jgi:glycosyltransferase involved in cell wall biosynthesis
MLVGIGDDRTAHELGVPKVEHTGSIDFQYWPSAVSQIGVGVAPLQDTRFNEAKSWLKPLEYSAVGVPWVASPRAEYRALHAFGCGALAEKNRDWVRELRRLVNDESYRAEKSNEARAVAARLTIEEHAWRWAEVWAEAVKLARSGTRSSRTPGTTLASR